jgi:hypothetical protein
VGKRVLMLLLVSVIVCSFQLAFCEEKDFPKQKIIAIATKAVKDAGISINEVDIIYDEGGKLWSEKIGSIAVQDKSPNYGILKKGFMKNYRIVYFDFKEPIKDVWVFVDKDTGEVLTVYREE